MNDLQRGEKIIEIFSEIKEKYGAIHGLDQTVGTFQRKRRSCGTTGCIGTVLADHLGNDVDFALGAGALGRALHLDLYDKKESSTNWKLDKVTSWVANTGLWHNKYHHQVFAPSDIAYRGTGHTGLRGCCNFWIKFGKRLVKKEEVGK